MKDKIFLVVMVGLLFVGCNTPLDTKAMILDMDGRHEASGNDYTIVGEVWNPTRVPIRSLKAACKGYDSDGDLVDIQITYTEPTPLNPGNWGVFTCRLKETRPIIGYVCKLFEGRG